MMELYNIIQKPVLSEKSYAGIAVKKYVFRVAKNATKPQIKKAVEEIFKVQVESVNTANIKGKYKRQGRHEGYTSDFKKAYVQLKPSSPSISFFDNLV
ncbi:MAG: 50S ribosomal protein L23 [Firmicutes bacterium]|nr:50S ribosomal protein L23 [Bacillota bacterium]